MKQFNFPIFYSIEGLERAYTYNSMGHWFDRDTMRFFKTRLTSHFRNLGRNTYAFITTEKGPSGVRRASIRIDEPLNLDRFYSEPYTPEAGARVAARLADAIGDPISVP
jgi:hypothetical protein